MDPPSNNDDVKPEKLEEKIEEGPSFHCDLFDTEIVHKIAQALLPGLSSATIDNTMGLFKSPGSVAVDIRREMVDYLFQRSENFVAESVILEGGPDADVSDHPYDIISDLIEDFSSSKRNIFSRLSGWLLSDRREDKIDDFVQDMEINGFWLLSRREAVAQTLLKNVDFKNAYHCDKKFRSTEDLAQHVSSCIFRMIDCMNEGCNTRFSAGQMDYHDSICPFKILPCEQKCSEMIMRREMDRHCITVCPMKLVNCSFYPVGCQLTVPKCLMDEHLSEYLQPHLVHILKPIHKEASLADLQKRAQKLEKLSPPGKLVAARGARPLQFAIRDLEAKLGQIEASKADEDTSNVCDQKLETIPKHEEREELLDEKEEHLESSPKQGETTDSSPRNSSTSPTKQENNRIVLLDQKEGHMGSDKKGSECKDLSPQKSLALPSIQEEGKRKSVDGKEEHVESFPKYSEFMDSSPRKSSVSPPKHEENRNSLDRKEEHVESSPEHGESTDSSPEKSSELHSPYMVKRKSLDGKKENTESSPKHSKFIDSSPMLHSEQEERRKSLDGIKENVESSPKQSESTDSSQRSYSVSPSKQEGDHLGLESERQMPVKSPATENKEQQG